MKLKSMTSKSSSGNQAIRSNILWTISPQQVSITISSKCITQYSSMEWEWLKCSNAIFREPKTHNSLHLYIQSVKIWFPGSLWHRKMFNSKNSSRICLKKYQQASQSKISCMKSKIWLASHDCYMLTSHNSYLMITTHIIMRTFNIMHLSLGTMIIQT